MLFIGFFKYAHTGQIHLDWIPWSWIGVSQRIFSIVYGSDLTSEGVEYLDNSLCWQAEYCE